MKVVVEGGRLEDRVRILILLLSSCQTLRNFLKLLEAQFLHLKHGRVSVWVNCETMQVKHSAQWLTHSHGLSKCYYYYYVWMWCQERVVPVFNSPVIHPFECCSLPWVLPVKVPFGATWFVFLFLRTIWYGIRITSPFKHLVGNMDFEIQDHPGCPLWDSPYGIYIIPTFFIFARGALPFLPIRSCHSIANTRIPKSLRFLSISASSLREMSRGAERQTGRNGTFAICHGRNEALSCLQSPSS